MAGERFRLGFTQHVELAWMEATLAYARESLPEAQIRELLDRLLSPFRSVGQPYKKNNSRGKTIQILMRIWVRPPDKLKPLRDEALALSRDVPQALRIVFHWGMAGAVYPYFLEVAESVGRLLRLQEVFSTGQVVRRVEGRLGDRPSVQKSTKRVLQTFLSWQVLQQEKGVRQSDHLMKAASPLVVERPDVAGWLLSAILFAHEDRRLPQEQLMFTPRLFPFKVPPETFYRALEETRRLQIMMHGLNQALVVVRDVEEVGTGGP